MTQVQTSLHECSKHGPISLSPFALSYNIPERECTHGIHLDDMDPQKKGRILSSEAYIMHICLTCNDCLYHILPTSCRELWLQNLPWQLYRSAALPKQQTYFTYNWLFDILHDTQETRYPLAPAFQSASHSRSVWGLGPLSYPYMYSNLRVAYNCFLRL